MRTQTYYIKDHHKEAYLGVVELHNFVFERYIQIILQIHSNEIESRYIDTV